MASENVAVLDFGSSKLTVLVGAKGIGNSALVKAKGISDYAGFMDGEFLDGLQLAESVKQAIFDAQSMVHKKIKKLYVGVPAEFSYNITKQLDLFFNKPTKIRRGHLKQLFRLESGLQNQSQHTIINQTPIYFKLDDGKKITNPLGQEARSLHALVSFVFADNYFIDTVKQVVANAGIKRVEFVSNALSEGLYLVSPEKRLAGSVLIDCGYITTSVAHIMGEGLLDLKSFSLGGGHIASDLGEVLHVSFDVAEQIKRKLVVSLDAQPTDYYEAMQEGELVKFGAKFVNDIALARIDMIAAAIESCFSEFSSAATKTKTVYLTGGGLSYIKGIKDYLSKLLKKDIVLIAPNELRFDKPDLSSEIALLEVAVGIENS